MSSSLLLAGLPQSPGGWIDILFGTFLLLSAVLGGIRGGSRELGNVIGFAAALVILVLTLPWMGQAFQASTRLFVKILTITALLLATILGGRLARLAVGKLISLVFPKTVDRIIGALFRFCGAAILCLLFYSFVRLIPSESLHQSIFSESVLGRIASPIVSRIVQSAASSLPAIHS